MQNIKSKHLSILQSYRRILKVNLRWSQTLQNYTSSLQAYPWFNQT